VQRHSSLGLLVAYMKIVLAAVRVKSNIHGASFSANDACRSDTVGLGTAIAFETWTRVLARFVATHIKL